MLPAGCPSYSVKRYRDDFYKLIRFNHPLFPQLPPKREKERPADHEGKFSQAYSRARSVVFQLALCNDWDYFFTGTIDQAKFDRYDLKPYYKALSQWIRDQNKKYRCKIQYVLIPELHEDGAWHVHGFFRGLPEGVLFPFVRGLHPAYLVDNGFLNWPAYQEKFGFCSLGAIRDNVGAAFYVCKYIAKDMTSSGFGYGAHMYRASIGLKRAQPLGYVYGDHLALDMHLPTGGQYCDVAYVRDVSWAYWLDFVDLPEIPWGVPDYLKIPEEPVVLTNVPLDQLSLFDIAGSPPVS